MNSAAIDTLAERLPRCLAGLPVLSRLKSVEAGGPAVVLVACSGGSDSVAAALWTCAHFPDLRKQGRICLAHVDHGLRGADAAADAAFVEALGARLGLAATSRRFVAQVDASEAELRRQRHFLLEEIAEEQRAETIILGHQADDVLENLLFRIGRGSSLAGLAGLRPVQVFPDRPWRLRPLLRVSRAEITTVLRAIGQPWREDASNASRMYTRNHLRHQVVPRLKEVFSGRDVQHAALAVHQQLGELDELVETLAEQWLNAHEDEAGALPRLALQSVNRAVVRRILEKWSRRLEGQVLPRTILSQLFEVLDVGETGQWSLGGGHAVTLTADKLVLANQTPSTQESPGIKPMLLQADGELPWPAGGVLRSRIVDLDASRLNAVRSGDVQPHSEAYLAVEEGGETALCVRTWCPGDRFRPLGAPGSRKLQDWFTDRGIPPARRHQLPIVCTLQGEVVWTPGFPPAESRRLASTAARALWLTYRHDSAP